MTAISPRGHDNILLTGSMCLQLFHLCVLPFPHFTRTLVVVVDVLIHTQLGLPLISIMLWLFPTISRSIERVNKFKQAVRRYEVNIISGRSPESLIMNFLKVPHLTNILNQLTIDSLIVQI